MKMSKIVLMMKKLAAESELQGADIEDIHSQADELLQQALLVLGQDELVAAFDRVNKWYA